MNNEDIFNSLIKHLEFRYSLSNIADIYLIIFRHNNFNKDEFINSIRLFYNNSEDSWFINFHKSLRNSDLIMDIDLQKILYGIIDIDDKKILYNSIHKLISQ